MPKTRDILIHVSVGVAVRERKCHRSSKHQIGPGQRHLVIRNEGGLGSKNYCAECAMEILTGAGDRLAAMISELRGS